MTADARANWGSKDIVYSATVAPAVAQTTRCPTALALGEAFVGSLVGGAVIVRPMCIEYQHPLSEITARSRVAENPHRIRAGWRLPTRVAGA